MIESDSIIVYDDFLSKDEHQFVLNYCYSSSYHYGESDFLQNFNPKYCTGLVHNVFPNDNLSKESKKFYDLFSNSIQEKIIKIKSLEMYRMYINCFAPSENPYFHIDGKGYTLLYYANDNWDVNDGGETQFFIDNNLYGVIPVPNRLVIFNAGLLHKATSFRNRHRFTVAIKYQ